MKKVKPALKYILLPLGGAALLMFFNIFFKAPPGRAEYDRDKVRTEEKFNSLDGKFKMIQTDLILIKKALLIIE